MKIGLVLSKSPAYSETFFKSKIQGLIENGHEVTLFCQNKSADFDLCPIKTLGHVFKNPVKQAFFFIISFMSLLPYSKKVTRFYKLEKSAGSSTKTILKRVYINAPFFKTSLDWVHFGFATMALDRELVPKAIEANCAVSFRGFDIAIYPIKNPNCYGRLWQHVDLVHTISDDLLEIAYKLGLSKQTAYRKITPAIDVSNFKREALEFQPLEEPLKILSVARLHWKKGLIDTLEGLSLLKDKVDFEYTIIGTGDQLEEIRFAIDQLGLKEKVVLEGKLPHKKVKKRMEKANVYLQYSISEGFCNAVLEAQAMGLICIVSDAEGLPENVQHDHSGFVIEKRQPKKLANALLKVLELSEDQRKAMRLNAVKRVYEQFNLVKQKAEFNAFYK